MRRLFRAIAIAALGLTLGACARSTDAPSSPEPNPAIQGTGGPCDSEGNAIVVVSDAGDFYRFHPDTLEFELLARAACTGDSARGFVWTAAVEASSNAWLQYVDVNGPAAPSMLFPVNTNDGSCGTPISYDDPDAPAYLSATDTPGILQGLDLGTTSSGDELRASVSLVTFDTHTAKVIGEHAIGPFNEYQLPVDAAVTQTKDGALYAFFDTLSEAHDVHPFFATIDPKTDVLSPTPGIFPHLQTPTLSTNAPDPDEALVLWGGSRFLFTGDPATRSGIYLASGSMVTRWTIDGALPTILVRSLPFLVVGAGLVSCASGPAPH